MTTIRLAFDDDAGVDVSGMCGAIYFANKDDWVEIALEKKTAEKLLKGLKEAIDKWDDNWATLKEE